jgi:hypothetical protein
MTRPSSLSHCTILTALVLFTLIFRLLTLMMPHTGVDERDYWSAGKAIVSEAPYPDVQHRTVRWPIILPVALTQLLFGTHPNVYYVAPLVVGCLVAALFYSTGRRLGGRLVGFFAALGFILFPYMIRAGSQIRPEIFGVLFMLLAIRFLHAHAGAGAQGHAPAPVPNPNRARFDRNLLFIAGALFLAYLTKITSVFFVPGVLLYLWLRPRLETEPAPPGAGFRDALIVALILLGLFLSETLLYGLFRGQWLGRAGVILENHLSQDFAPLPSVWALFRRYAPENLPLYWSVPLALFPVAAAYLWKARRRATAALFVLPLATFLFVFTFAVSSLDPVVPTERFIHRYFMPALPFVLLLDSLAFVTLLSTRRIEHWAHRIPPAPAAVGFLAVMLLGISAVFASGKLPESVDRYYTSPLNLSEHPLTLNSRYLRQLNAAYLKGTPLVARPGTAGSNALYSASRYYLLPGIIGSGPYPNPAQASFNRQPFVSLHRGPLPELNPDTAVILVERNPFRPEAMTLQEALAVIERPES